MMAAPMKLTSLCILLTCWGVALSLIPDWLVTPITMPTTCSSTPQGNLRLTNGIIGREFMLKPNFFTFDLYSYEKDSSVLRAIDPEARIGLDGVVYAVGGVVTDTPRAYLNRTYLMSHMAADPTAFQYVGHTVTDPVAPYPYKPQRHAPTDIVWPPKGKRLDVLFAASSGADPRHKGIHVTVSYEMYDGIPLISKWVTIHASPGVAGSVYSVEYLAVNQQWAQHGYGWMYTDVDQPHGPAITWESDPAPETIAGGFQPVVNCSYSNTFSVQLDEDMVSFKARHLLVGSADPERMGLAQRRVLRLLAPQTQENPIFFHMTLTDKLSLHNAIDQMAETGFEMMILSFGTAFSPETRNASYVEFYKDLVNYAHSKNIEVGGYDLIALSRKAGGIYEAYDALDPATMKPIGSMCFASGWYDYLLDQLLWFLDKTGISMLETDGPYGGYQCASTNHSHHHDAADSIYRQNQLQAKFYEAMLSRGVYTNQPDKYFYAGGSKTGMGYNENQYSLPRWQDLSVSRQGMFDDTLQYTPTVGWMFLPISVYHGGGAAAEFMPLSQHLTEYEWGLAQYLGAGVAACYRGPHLYDTPQTKALVTKWVTFFKKYRDILTSDIIHVRRADMQGVDGFLHVNPKLDIKGLAMVFNPTETHQAVNLTIPLYYSGLTNTASIAEQGGAPKQYTLMRDFTVQLSIDLTPKNITWFTIK